MEGNAMKVHLTTKTLYPNRYDVVHYPDVETNACGMTMYGNFKRQQFDPQMTTDINQVTCKKCLKAIARKEKFLEWKATQ